MAKLRIKELPLIYKTLILVSLIAVYIIASIYIFYSSQNKIDTNKKVLTDIYLQKTAYINNTQKLLNNFIVYNYISNENLDFTNYQNAFAQTNDSLDYNIKQFSILISTYEESEQLNKLKTQIEIFKNIIYELLYEYRSDIQYSANISRLLNKELLSYEEIIKDLITLKNINHKYFVDSVQNIQKTLNTFYILAIVIFIIFILIFTFLLYFLFSDNFRDTEKTHQYLSKLSNGNTVKVTKSKNNSSLPIFEYINDINDIYLNLNTYIDSLISKNYDLKIENNENPLYSSITKLSYQLIESEKDLEKRRKEDQQKEWSNNGKNIFTDIMRRNANDIQKLADEIIIQFVKYLDASVGGLYILRGDTAEEQYLELLSAFAYDRKKYYTKRIGIGDGLIGTAAQDQSPIYIKEIPEDYLEIQSGLGDAPPNNLFIIPLLTDNGLQGVLEIASFDYPEQYEINFAEEIARNIASTLESVKINTKTVELLKESQKKSDELAEREKVLQETMKEVSKAHEVARRNEIELRGILSGVDQTLMRAEYLPDGSFLNSNLVHRRVMGYELEQMKGKNIIEFIQEEERENFKRLWDDVVSGRPYHITVKRKNRQTNQDVWLLNQYTPIKDDTGTVIKVLYLAIDITEQKVAEERATNLLKDSREIQTELEGVLSGIDNTILRAEYTGDGVFLNSNKIHQSVLGYDIHDMLNKSIMDFVQTEEQAEFKKMWDEISSGKTKEIVVKRFNKQTGREIWLLNQYTPIRNEAGKVVKILYLAIDITEQKISEEKANQLLKTAKDRELLLSGFQSAIDKTMMRAEYYIDGTFIDANELHASTLGYDIENMRGKNILEFIQEEERPNFQKIWNRVKRGHLEQITVQRYNKSTGKLIWLINQYVPIVNEQEDIIRVLYLAIDITEQKTAEERATKLLSEEKNKEIELKGFQSAIDKTVLRALYDADGIFLDSNTIHQQVLGYQIEEMLGKNILEFVQVEDKESFLQLWNNIRQGNQEQLVVKRLNKHTNKEVWLLNQYTPILNEEGNVVRIIYLAIDITEQKEAEEIATRLMLDAKNKELNLSAILAGLDKTVLRAEYSPEGIFIDSNSIHRETLGYEIESMKGENILDFIPEEEKETFTEIWKNVVSGSMEQIVVKRYNKKTNKEIWLLNQYIPIIEENNQASKIVYLAIDITGQKRLEQDLITQQEIMERNMNDLLTQYESLDNDYQKAKNQQTQVDEKFDSETDKLYNQWLNSFE